ncbi:protein LMBR1L-like isoform X2 [Acanthaster planci]|uniref:Protein LMBR1L-like isoform X2 n=1 Tax=Acanthaster planci TaxID=133434 RepID=A0A8B7ZSY0_ACAPL|nr:protein LMBR1L-like isoform X2 [Acanthaster planci]
MMEHHWDSTEQIFHDAIREYLIDLLFFTVLYISSYLVICRYKRQADKEDYFSDASDAIVYRVALWSCTFTLAISVGAGLLLPFSILSNEVLVFYPNNFYMRWLNGSLIHGLWNLIFLFSNLSLFVLMPFAYFLTESEGFAGSKKGIKARVYETFVVLIILGLLVFGMVWVASAIMDSDSSSRETLSRVWSYLPYLYTCISLLGVLMLLISTPLGFTRMFSVIGQLVVKPQFMENLEEEYHLAKFEEDDLLRKMQGSESSAVYSIEHTNGQTELRQRLAEVQRDRKVLDRRRKASSWQRNLGYPLLWILLFALTVLSLCVVGWNIFRLLFGIGFFSVSIKEAGLGKVSLSMLGSFGALIEVTLICYLMLASVVGFYTVPFFRSLVPRVKDTPMTKVIANCLVILILSSALPLLSRTLGVTSYDLIGEFGRSDWLQNFYLVIGYNLLFSILTSSCLLNKFTSTVRVYIQHSVAQYVHNVREANHFRTSSFWSQKSQNGNTAHVKGTNGVTAVDTGAMNGGLSTKSE